MRKNKEQFAKAISSSKEYPDALYQSTYRLDKETNKREKTKANSFSPHCPASLQPCCLLFWSITTSLLPDL